MHFLGVLVGCVAEDMNKNNAYGVVVCIGI
jgi:hypothetical protein